MAGFTLIEIMVVVVILGILAAVVVPNLIGQTYEAQRKRALADVRTLETAIELFKLDNFVYPQGDIGMEALLNSPNGKKYLRRDKLPEDPWGNPYVYLYPGARGEFDLYSFGADGSPGGEGEAEDIGSWMLN